MSKRRKPTPPPVATGPTPMRRRAYEGAVMNRLTADWVTSSTSADAEIDGSLVRLRNRTRQLCRDNAYARQALRAIGLNIIGQGIRMQARVPGAGNMPDQRASAAIEQLWRRWTRHDYCHCAGRLAFEEIARLAVQAMAESGDVFIRLVPQAFGRSPVPLGLEVLEADLVDEGKTEGPDRDGNEWRLGVRVNRWGRPIAYRFRTRHPGDVAGYRDRLRSDRPGDGIRKRGVDIHEHRQRTTAGELAGTGRADARARAGDQDHPVAQAAGVHAALVIMK